jgi:tight adherence protein C
VTWLPPALDAWLNAQFGELAPMVLVGGAGLLLILSSLPFLLKKPADPFSKLKNDATVARQSEPGRQSLRQSGSGDKLERYSWQAWNGAADKVPKGHTCDAPELSVAA